MLQDLGRWATRRRRATKEKDARAKQVLDHLPHSREELRQQWALQKTTQVSVRKSASS